MKHGLITSAAATTFTLWAATLVTATTNLGSQRLHVTAMTGALTATLWLLVAVGLHQLRRTVYQFDRGYTTGVRGVVAGLLDATHDRDLDDDDDRPDPSLN
jgi:hypothetical protein